MTTLSRTEKIEKLEQLGYKTTADAARRSQIALKQRLPILKRWASYPAARGPYGDGFGVRTAGDLEAYRIACDLAGVAA